MPGVAFSLFLLTSSFHPHNHSRGWKMKMRIRERSDDKRSARGPTAGEGWSQVRVATVDLFPSGVPS